MPSLLVSGTHHITTGPVGRGAEMVMHMVNHANERVHVPEYSALGGACQRLHAVSPGDFHQSRHNSGLNASSDSITASASASTSAGGRW
jgi:hypothetical protein